MSAILRTLTSAALCFVAESCPAQAAHSEMQKHYFHAALSDLQEHGIAPYLRRCSLNALHSGKNACFVCPI